nr:immunoglobulin superfamily member 3-like [Paramormyrops kingsleyae]
MFRLFGLLIFINTALAVDVVQPSLLMRVQLGDSVTLTCFCPEETTFVAWFKQAVGQKPQLMAKALRYVSGKFDEEYENIKRYSLQNAKGSFNVTISNAEPSDSAVYYCAAVFLHEVTFGNGTFVIITGKDSNSRTVVQQPVSDTVQPGDSVSLQCTIETGSCAGEHSVYWFRHGSGESLPGVIYSHGNRSDECEKSPEAGSPTRSCVYSLPKRNLSLSDAGTYYCAVAMCGEVLFGNGTQLDIDGFHCSSEMMVLICLSIIRAGLLLCALLIFTLCYGAVKVS